MNPDNPLDKSDKALFLSAIGEIKPIRHRHVIPEKIRPEASIRKQLEDDNQVMEELLSNPDNLDLLDTGEHLAYTRSGVQNAVLRKLRSGGYSLQSELDLHGLSRDQARAEIVKFIQQCRERGKYCVRIIHGKGRKNTFNAPVLKPAVNHWLQQHKWVMAFCSAPSHDGGTGAVYVLLRK